MIPFDTIAPYRDLYMLLEILKINTKLFGQIYRGYKCLKGCLLAVPGVPPRCPFGEECVLSDPFSAPNG